MDTGDGTHWVLPSAVVLTPAAVTGFIDVAVPAYVCAETADRGKGVAK